MAVARSAGIDIAGVGGNCYSAYTGGYGSCLANGRIDSGRGCSWAASATDASHTGITCCKD